MSLKNMSALAIAAASLAAATLVTGTAASASPPHLISCVVGKGCTNKPYHGGSGTGGSLPPVYHDPDHDRDRDHWPVEHRPYEVIGGERTVINQVNAPAPVTHVSAPVNAVAQQPTEPCNCLTKQYLKGSSVLFSDTCTKESALATPAQARAQ
jgi:hypothetical protein